MPTQKIGSIVPESQVPVGFPGWRGVHLAVAAILSCLAVIHSALTVRLYEAWSADAVWLLGTGLGLPLLGLLNRSHVGVEPCQERSARFVRSANWGFTVFGIGALIAVPAPEAFVIAGALVAQAVAAHWTLPGPT